MVCWINGTGLVLSWGIRAVRLPRRGVLARPEQPGRVLMVPLKLPNAALDGSFSPPCFSQSLQRVLDSRHRVHGEFNSLLVSALTGVPILSDHYDPA